MSFGPSENKQIARRAALIEARNSDLPGSQLSASTTSIRPSFIGLKDQLENQLKEQATRFDYQKIQKKLEYKKRLNKVNEESSNGSHKMSGVVSEKFDSEDSSFDEAKLEKIKVKDSYILNKDKFPTFTDTFLSNFEQDWLADFPANAQKIETDTKKFI